MKFELHSIDTAPEAVKPELESAQKAYGSIPNLYRGFASNPATPVRSVNYPGSENTEQLL